MKKILIVLLSVGLIAVSAEAMLKMLGKVNTVQPPEKVEVVAAVVKEDAPKAVASSSGSGKKFLIDDFESGSLKKPRDWWTFDLQKAKVSENEGLTKGEKKVALEAGKYSLLLAGRTTDWYAGGCGTYLAVEGKDLSQYDSLQLDVYGNGAGSGTLKVELVDDDNKNWQAEQDPKKNYALTADDKFSYELKVDWTGWQRVTIPFADFNDENEEIGDDIWNPQQTRGSGGLLQFQFICLAAKAKGDVLLSVDNVALISNAKSEK